MGLSAEDDAEAETLARFFWQTCDTIEQNLSASTTSVEDAFRSEGKEEMKSDDNDISEWLESQKFAVVDLSAETFYYANDVAQSAAQMSKDKIKRLRKDISILSSSLPDGIFVRVDENRMDIIKVLIIGPAGTPYENGCFFFDLFLPSDYPNSCPKMVSLTTGSHAFRFNPNLYNDGKICISLLGTWSGPGWDPATSTILQLLVSIQALVFVDYPLENEPGYEGRALDPDSLSYNKGLHRATALYAMVWHLSGQDPTTPKCFNEIVSAFLKNRKEEIMACFRRWDIIDASAGDICYYFSWEHALQGLTWDQITTALIGLIDGNEIDVNALKNSAMAANHLDDFNYE